MQAVNEHKPPLVGRAGAGGNSPHGCLTVCVFGFACLVGYFAIVDHIVPAWQAWRSADWELVPAWVVRAEYDPGDEEEDEARLHVRYRYIVGGTAYIGNRYDFLDAAMRGHEANRKIVRTLLDEREVLTFVDPDDPTRSVLSREVRISRRNWWGLVACGLIIALLVPVALRDARDFRRGGLGGVTRYATFRRSQRAAAAPYVVSSAAGRAGAVVGWLAALLAGMIVVGFLTWLVADTEPGTKQDGPLTFLQVVAQVACCGLCFVVPLVGLIVAWQATRNPNVVLTFHDGAPRLGEASTFAYEFRDQPAAIKSLSICVEADEQSTRTRGRRSSDIRVSPIYREHVLKRDDPGRSGKATMHLPNDLAPTIDSASNAIKWRLHVSGEVEGRPEISDRLTLHVRSAKPGSQKPAVQEVKTYERGVSVQLDQNVYRPGDKLVGQVSWKFDAPPPSAEVRLAWFTFGDGDRSTEIITRLKLPRPQAEDTRRFELTLPDGPTSFRGTHVCLTWCAEVVFGGWSGGSGRADFDLIAHGDTPPTLPVVEDDIDGSQ